MRNRIRKSKHKPVSVARLQRQAHGRSSGRGPNRPNTDPDREERITMEVVVDAYDASERATGWFGYLENELEFPFTARCTERWATRSRSFQWRPQTSARTRCSS